jgi:hypothetical protein
MPSATPDIPVPVDPSAETVLQVAAWYGTEANDEVFVSYTTLLLGLLYAPIGNANPWQAEAHRALDVEAIKASKGLQSIDDRRVPGSPGIDPREGAWPTGRDMFSASARNVLQEAFTIAQRERGTSTVVMPADIMASFLSVVPPAHSAQASEWKFSPAASVLMPMLKGSTTAPTGKVFNESVSDTVGEVDSVTATATGPATLPDLPGYDAPASAVLRLSFVFAGRRKEAKRALLRSAGLMVALAEAEKLLPPADAELARMLHGMLDADGRYAAQRDAAYAMPPDIPAAVAGAGSTFPPLSNNTQPILDDARVIAAQVSPGAPVGVRHLLAALLTLPDGTDRASDARTRLREAGADTDTLREALARIVQHRHAADNQAAWRRMLTMEGPQSVAVVQPDAIPADPRAKDDLGLRRYSDAIGALIAAQEQQPPLSIAVFGPWGSGKSYFMRMIRQAVEHFSEQKGERFPTTRPTRFLTRVVQIEFNAWHYAEGNLWASLVHTILVGIERELQTKAQPHVFQEMLDRLQLRKAAQEEAEARLRDAAQRREEAQAALRQADLQLAARRGDEGNVPSAEDVLRAVRDEALAAIAPAGDQAGTKEWIENFGKSVAASAEYLGREKLPPQVSVLVDAGSDVAAATAALQVTVGDVRDLLDEAHASATRGLGLLGWLANARVSRDRLILFVLLGLIALVLLIALAQELESRGSEIAATMTTAATLFGAVTTAIGGAVAWGKKHLAEASRALATLGSVRERVEARQAQRLTERDAALLAARRATSEAEAEAARRRADYEAAVAGVAQAERDLQAATSAERLKRFVAQRLAEGDYQRHLGLIHTIRSDLEQLRAILKSVHPKEREHGAEPPVQRIVLYIDDLDRCPPSRVVEVLEAVHLLLAFPLFVVVVGVDVRWVTQALHERYPKQLGDGPGIASPLDYLEKVFQIPFWLPPMNAAAGQKLLESAVGPAAPASRPGEAPTVQAGTTPAAAGPDGAASDATDAAPQPGDAATPAAAASPAAADAQARAVAEALVLGAAERARLLDMAAAIGASPRRAKRFANLYRLLKASLSPAERRGFALDDGKAGSYQAALILLALSTGAPRAASALIARLGTTPDGALAPLLAELEAESMDEERAAVSAAAELMRAVEDQAGLAADLRIWASGVQRFNFDGRPAQRRAAPAAQATPSAQTTPAPAAPPKRRAKPKAE